MKKQQGAAFFYFIDFALGSLVSGYNHVDPDLVFVYIPKNCTIPNVFKCETCKVSDKRESLSSEK